MGMHAIPPKDDTSVETGQILLVDDDETLVDLHRQLLSLNGMDTVGVTSSGQALEVFRTAPMRFKLVITDLVMPGMNGLELSSEILKTRSDVPIVLCTGYRERVLGENLSRSGIRKVLFKPFRSAELLEIIRKLLEPVGSGG